MKKVSSLIVSLFVLSQNIDLSEQKKGKDFFLVGDYAWVQDLKDAYLTFDAMDQIKSKAKSKNQTLDDNTEDIDDIDYFLTMGDNLYPLDPQNPTETEFDQMIGLFKERENIKNIPIYPIRGNHDCIYNKDILLNLSLKEPTWQMPYYYYTKEIEVGSNGEKLGLLMVDSCLLICSNYSYGKIDKMHQQKNRPFHSHDLTIQNLKDITCSSEPWYIEEGNKMYEWIMSTLDKWDKDPKIIWKASVQHHPMFGKWYTDMDHLTADYLPILLDHKFDLYLNGHEHDLEYANYPYEQVPEIFDFKEIDQDNHQKDSFLKHDVDHQVCSADVESFFDGKNENSTTNSSLRISVYKKGDAIHQITTGTTGYDLYPICLKRPSMGRWKYSQNIYHGFTQMHVDEHQISLKIKGVDATTKEIKQLYEIKIERDPSEKSEIEQEKISNQFIQ